jgi:ATP-dependent RNA helicase DeaD
LSVAEIQDRRPSRDSRHPAQRGPASRPDRRPADRFERQVADRFERQPRSRRPEGNDETGMVSLTLSKGRVHGVRPADVVSTIAHHAGIPGGVIGRIQIDEHHTRVDVPERFVAQVLARADSFRIHRQEIDVRQA